MIEYITPTHIERERERDGLTENVRLWVTKGSKNLGFFNSFI